MIHFVLKARRFYEKEAVICYLSAYVFRTMYRRIRLKNSSNLSICQQQCLSLLLAGQSRDTNDLPEHKLVNTLDRGGLWKVTSDVISIFINQSEATFQTATQKCISKNDSKEIVKYLMKHSCVLSIFSRIQANLVVKKEVTMSLLYTHVVCTNTDIFISER